MRLPALLLTAGFIAACNKSPEPAKIPISGQPAGEALPPSARSAIDSGNVLLRAGDPANAVVQYRLATTADPQNAAPWYGVMMAAQRLGNAALADSASKMVAKLSGTPALTDTAMAKMHAQGGGGATAGGLPPGHPPAGHPPMNGPLAPPAPPKTTGKKTT
jgi:predicted Zn-dependent protease